jgi:hypothetical protein
MAFNLCLPADVWPMASTAGGTWPDTDTDINQAVHEVAHLLPSRAAVMAAVGLMHSASFSLPCP